MIITLYKNCILSDSYSEVFNVFTVDMNNKTCHERYLDTLAHYTINAPDVYVPQSGKISFMLNENNEEFYEYNYMKLVNEKNGFTRYCFIDSIAVVNSAVVVNYIEDIWSNYAPSMQVRKALLTRSRIIDYGSYKIPFYSLGMEYQGNKPLKYRRIDFEKGSVGANPRTDVNVVFQMQLYQLAEQGNYSNRIVLEGVLVDSKATGDARWTTTLQLAEFYLQTIYSRQGIDQVTYNGESYYYELYDILIIPRSLGIPQNTNIFSEATITNVAGTQFGFGIINPLNIDPLLECATVRLQPNWKQFKIGTLSKGIDIVQNGTPLNVTLYITPSFTDFKIYLGFQNQLIEITDQFMYKLPISVQTADATQQQATAREVANLNAKLGIASGALKTAGGVNDLLMGSAQVGFGAMTGHLGSVLGGASQIADSPLKMGQGVISIVGSAKQLEFANRAQYTTNKGTETSIETRMNAYNGIVVYEIDPDNEVEVRANINNAGYVVNEIVDNLFITQTTGVANKYNVMQFEYANIYGKFSQRVADTLREILYSGFKIWYDETAVNE